MKDKIIVALDGMELPRALDFAKKVPFTRFKVGPALFYQHGPAAVRELSTIRKDIRIFLDLKCHDIPNTVSEGIAALAGLPLEFLTIHLTGGKAMIDAALESARRHLPETKLLGVSYLTSLGEEDFQQHWNTSGTDLLPAILAMGVARGIHGIVLSPQDLPLLKGEAVLKVCPGIRFADDNQSDQKRIATPKWALDQGADLLVMGRSLTRAADLDGRLAELQ